MKTGDTKYSPFQIIYKHPTKAIYKKANLIKLKSLKVTKSDGDDAHFKPESDFTVKQAIKTFGKPDKIGVSYRGVPNESLRTTYEVSYVAQKGDSENNYKSKDITLYFCGEGDADQDNSFYTGYFQRK